MYRSLVLSSLALILCVVVVVAKEYPDAQVTNIDVDKNTITAKVGDKDVTFAFTKDTTFGFGKKAMDPDKLAKFAEKVVNVKGAKATIVTREEKDKEVTDKDGKPVADRVTFTFKRGKDKED